MITTLLHCISKEWFTIQQEKKYYNQRFIINQIQNDTGCSARDIGRILSSLRDLVKDKLSDSEDSELKIFPGLKVTSRYIPTEQSNLNFCNNGTINSDFLLYLNGEFSHRFKEEIKQLHKEKQWNQLFLADKNREYNSVNTLSIYSLYFTFYNRWLYYSSCSMVADYSQIYYCWRVKRIITHGS